MDTQNKETDIEKWRELRQEVDKLGGAVEKHKPLYKDLRNFWVQFGVPKTEPLAVEDWETHISSNPEYLNSSFEEKYRTNLVIRGMWYGMTPHE